MTKKNTYSKNIKFKTAYEIPDHPGTSIDDEIITQQHFKDEADVYNVISRHSRGLPVPMNSKQPIYGDVSTPVPEQIQNLKTKLNEQQKNLETENQKLKKETPPPTPPSEGTPSEGNQA